LKALLAMALGRASKVVTRKERALVWMYAFCPIGGIYFAFRDFKLDKMVQITYFVYVLMYSFIKYPFW
jgi:hypothetical protein